MLNRCCANHPKQPVKLSPQKHKTQDSRLVLAKLLSLYGLLVGEVLLVTRLGMLPAKLIALHFSDHCCLSKSAMIPCGFQGSHAARSIVISGSRLILPRLILLGRTHFTCNRVTNLLKALEELHPSRHELLSPVLLILSPT